MNKNIEITLIDNKDKEEKNYDLIFEKQAFRIFISKNEENNKIIIKAFKINTLENLYYETSMSLEEIIKLDNILKACEKIEEIYTLIINFLEEKKVSVVRINDNYLILGLKIITMLGKEKIVELQLIQKKINQDSFLKESCKQINILKEENKNLKLEFNNIKQELDELKKWKKDKQEEINKLIKTQKNKNVFKYFDSKIINKVEDLELIEKAYKNNSPLLANKVFKGRLIYRATRDGDSAYSFHSKCDNIKGTLTLVKTKKGLIFGGYTEQNWNEISGNWKKDNKAFCFSIDLKKIYKNKNTNNSIYCSNSYCPNFGDDFFIINNNFFSAGGNTTEFNVNYETQNKIHEFNDGDEYFGIAELELFDITLD